MITVVWPAVVGSRFLANLFSNLFPSNPALSPHSYLLLHIQSLLHWAHGFSELLLPSYRDIEIPNEHHDSPAFACIND